MSQLDMKLLAMADTIEKLRDSKATLAEVSDE